MVNEKTAKKLMDNFPLGGGGRLESAGELSLQECFLNPPQGNDVQEEFPAILTQDRKLGYEFHRISNKTLD